MSKPKTTITMVGPTGVGKTSLLAAMYKELEAELQKCGCTLSQEGGPSQRAINDQLKELKKLANGSGVKVQVGEGIDGSQQERRYAFHLDVGDGGEPEATLEFVDLPGGWYTGTGDFERADQLLGESHVSFLAVDATALMERQSSSSGGLGKYHEDINAPLDIKDSYKRVSFQDGHMVILVLIRAETYVKSGAVNVLLDKAQVAYKELAKVLEIKKIPLYACYVETVGSLTFNSFTEHEDGKIESNFLRNPSIGYKPSRCAVPLRIAAGKALIGALDEAIMMVEKEGGLIADILTTLGFDTALKKAREKYNRVYQAFRMLAGSIDEDDFTQIMP